ncbi:MAG: DUF4012 domain-containing protein [Patescibacteria group bacterium]
MTKKHNKTKKFSLGVSLNEADFGNHNFVIDLRNKGSKPFISTQKKSKKTDSSRYFWRAKRFSGYLPFFFKPLTKHGYHGIFLDRRAEEIRDKFSAFERKIFQRTVLGKVSSFFLALFVIFIPLKLFAYYKLFDPTALKNRISISAHLAINDLVSATSAASRLDLRVASNDFSGATSHFLQAEGDLKNIDVSLLKLASLSGNRELRLASEGKNFLQAGASASSLGKHLSLALDGLFSKGDPKDSLNTFVTEGSESLKESEKLVKILEKIDPNSLPEEYRKQFLDLQKKVIILNDALHETMPAASKLGELLGVSRDKRYLLIFQNNTELRGGGGFMGSYALVDFSGGKVKNLEIPGGGTYDTKGGMTTFVKSPAALRLIAPRWYFWDSNWFPDWSLSAENIRWFYEKSGGPTVDGVIAFTPDIISGLLGITGPIDLTKEYGVVIDQNNFYEVTQQITEKDNLVKDGQLLPNDFLGTTSVNIASNSPIKIKQDLERNKGKKPKKIIGDLTAKILLELPKKIDRENVVKLFSLLEQSLSQKQLMFNFNDETLQAEVERRNFAGRQEKTAGDYLMVVNSNISGGKSDYKITEKIEQTAEIKSDGRILNTVKITRKHNGLKGEKLFGMKNVDWLRVYVPKGSQLVSSSGFVSPEPSLFKKVKDDWSERPLVGDGEGTALYTSNGTMIYSENDKTVFANWLIVDPGREASVVFSYYLPFKLTFSGKQSNDWQGRLNQLIFGENEEFANYTLLVQKQPGARASEFYSRLNLDSTLLNSLWVYPEQKEINPSGWSQAFSLDHDQSFGAIIKNNK